MSHDHNPQAGQMGDESMARNLAHQADAIWPQEQRLFDRYDLSAGARILDLGCGTGRIANPLAADGHAVVAVDNSEAMLARVVGAETVLGDVRSLDLGRQLDAVLALSNLINHPERSHRLDLLRVCHETLGHDGVIVGER